MIYTGIGSRETPSDICDFMKEIGTLMSKHDWILRSGGAKGADSAFEAGHTGKKEIYLPWRHFRRNKSKFYGSSERAVSMAKAVWAARQISNPDLPDWDRLRDMTRAFQSRNIHQVLGKNLNVRSDCIICWTKDGQEIGGTAQAMALARMIHVPVINLANDKPFRDFAEMVKNGTNPKEYVEHWEHQMIQIDADMLSERWVAEDEQSEVVNESEG